MTVNTFAYGHYIATDALLGARHKSPDQAAAGSIVPESHLAPANGINNLQMTFWRVEISGVLRGQSSVGAQEISPRREPWEACDIGQAPERGGRGVLGMFNSLGVKVPCPT